MKKNYKKTYITPEVEMLLHETTLLANTRWGVHPNDDEPWDETNPDHGNIFFDKGEGNNGEYDPWDSDNW